MKGSLLVLTLVFMSLVLFSCKKDNPIPPDEQPKINLTLEDTSCTEAWLKLTTANINLPAEATLKQDDNVIQTISLSIVDTLLYVDSLLPNTNYRYQVSSVEQVSSNELSVTTLDTTSNNFSWQKFYFGDSGSNIFYDCAFISNNNIWCAGIINVLDTIYNAVHWDGNEWELKRIYFPTVCGSTNQTPYPSSSIFAFEDGKIWMSSSGNKIAILQNNIQVNQLCLPSNVSMSINKIWGTSSDDLYVVGDSGNIAHFQNGNWRKIESGTNLSINDIYGAQNSLTGEQEILCVADDPYFQQPVQVIKVNDNNTSELLSNTGLGISIGSVWFNPGIRYYIVGNGLYEKNYPVSNQWFDLNHNRNLTDNYMNFIRGNGLNDIIVVGAFGEVLHFNGIKWESIKNNETSLIYGSYYKVAVEGNMIVAVGYDQNQAVVLLGHHQ